MDGLRINKFLAERAGLSRREADDAIESGRVLVDDKPARIGGRVNSGDVVMLDGREIPFEANFIYLALNKPVGYVCSRKRQGETPTLYELLPEKYHNLKTVGRLDKDSSGLILLTNDGDFAFRMTHPKFIKVKVYEVELNKDLEPLHQQEISDFGVMLDDGVSRLMLSRLDDEASEGTSERQKNGSRRKWRVEMSEGRNRQIRRTFKALGYNVEKLHRIKFGNYMLNGLKLGKYEEVRNDQK